jgi:S-adenosyl methyltransferase
MTRDRNAAGKAGHVTSGEEPMGKGVPFDTSQPHMARVYDFWLGGRDNYPADRAVAEQVAAAYPDVLIAVQAQRAFLARAVRRPVSTAAGTLPGAIHTHIQAVSQRFPHHVGVADSRQRDEEHPPREGLPQHRSGR